MRTFTLVELMEKKSRLTGPRDFTLVELMD